MIRRDYIYRRVITKLIILLKETLSSTNPLLNERKADCLIISELLNKNILPEWLADFFDLDILIDAIKKRERKSKYYNNEPTKNDIPTTNELIEKIYNYFN